jgi:hypothetical protein
MVHKWAIKNSTKPHQMLEQWEILWFRNNFENAFLAIVIFSVRFDIRKVIVIWNLLTSVSLCMPVLSCFWYNYHVFFARRTFLTKSHLGTAHAVNKGKVNLSWMHDQRHWILARYLSYIVIAIDEPVSTRYIWTCVKICHRSENSCVSNYVL